ncbi:MAG TPA: FliM/FliN family flagellar motor switch protein [Phycisphaerae bacterium]|nr:FliM/FliN family flagellar motor switch protein [Phycisphaerae bacterium]
MTEATTREDQAPPQEAAEGVEVREAELPEVEPRTVPTAGGQLDILLDTTMQVSVRLGQTEMPARELIQLGPGSVVTLDRRAGQPVELLLRGIPFAVGKLVVVGEQLGVKIEEILSPEDREDR